MDTPFHFVVPQDRETPVSYKTTGQFYYRLAYARSTDSRDNHEPGQDYLTYVTDGQRFAFAICDGVSQSFYGDIAARILGDKLLELVFKANFKQQRAQVQGFFTDELNRLTEEASPLVRDYSLPDELSPMVRTVLEKKRAIGSESTFVTGLIDFSANLAAFVWMGDSRLRLWRGDDDVSASLGGQFLTSERWSSVKGPVGEVHLTVTEPAIFDHLAAYTDGFSYLDMAFQNREKSNPFSNRAIDAFIADAALRPSSDDISFIEVWTTSTPPRVSVSNEISQPPRLQCRSENGGYFLSWTPAMGATVYEVKLSLRNQTTLSSFRVQSTEWQSDERWETNANLISVRAWHDQEPGPWSDFVSVDISPSVSRSIDDSHDRNASFEFPAQPGLSPQLTTASPLSEKTKPTVRPVSPKQSAAVPNDQTHTTYSVFGHSFQVDSVVLRGPKMFSRLWILGFTSLFLCILLALMVVVKSFPGPITVISEVSGPKAPVSLTATSAKTVAYPNDSVSPTGPATLMTPTQPATIAFASTDQPIVAPTNTLAPGQFYVRVSQGGEAPLYLNPADQTVANKIYSAGEQLIITGKYEYKAEIWYRILDPNTEITGWMNNKYLNLFDLPIEQIPLVSP